MADLSQSGELSMWSLVLTDTRLEPQLMRRRPARSQPDARGEARLPVSLPASRHGEAGRHNRRDCRQVLRAHQVGTSRPG
ncbi:hypothetical protein IG631_13355 [Alternaria alternata]|nr:hypothetical protein IG631_13355 [Alternaria alternata]